MGIELHGLKFLKRCQDLHSLNLKNTLTLGRQGLHVNAANATAVLCRNLNTELFVSGYAENILKSMGALHVDSMDASDYEGANIVHDLNRKRSTEPLSHFCHSSGISG